MGHFSEWEVLAELMVANCNFGSQTMSSNSHTSEVLFMVGSQTMYANRELQKGTCNDFYNIKLKKINNKSKAQNIHHITRQKQRTLHNKCNQRQNIKWIRVPLTTLNN